MDFSTKAMEEITAIVAEEIGKQIKIGEINQIEELENGIREVLKEIGERTYGKVLEKEDMKLGKRIECECGNQAQRIMEREAKILTVFGWVSYRRSYYGCGRCGKKEHRPDVDWGICPGDTSPVMGKLLAVAGVDIAFERVKRKINEFLLVDVRDNAIRKQT